MARKVRREIVLGAVAVALVAAGLLSRGRSSPGNAGSAAGVPRAQPAARAGQSAAPAGSVVELDLTVLEAPKAVPADTERNPFQFRAAARPSGAGPAPSDGTPGSGAAPPGGGGTVIPPAPAPPPRILLKFIGVVQAPNAGRVAVLSDGRGVYHGREGDTIEGRYRILKIGVESVELAFIDGRGRQVIRLTGQ